MVKRSDNKILNVIYVLIGFIGLLLIWEISSKINNNPSTYPDVIDTFKKLIELLSNQQTYKAIFTSLGTILITLLISFIFAIILGTLSGLFNSINKILTPLITFMKVIPTACIVVLLIVFVKSFYSTIIVIFLVVFPILYEAIVNGIKNIDKNIINSLRLEGLYTWNSISKVIIPSILPYMYVGIVSSFGLGMKVEIMSEIIVGSASIAGLGHLIYLSYAVNFDFVELFALSILTLISFGIIDTILYFVKKLIKEKYNF
jgi:ABC-type nitrate/sulfonate/bicarbonate transport system, permease component